ncbi:hypothetical protein BJ875DRAFT_162689 [Amylocarpus encephaloides]|uniref:MARVEL domain-containing protein n=1 Tax=Amylocarpus encephaloides TaxID=45428 RepID=A0A9P7YAN2_9HELO|nr:hypothetical protein BJ875DRAFT_162689 [Amylocarpus encephaloides]
MGFWNEKKGKKVAAQGVEPLRNSPHSTYVLSEFEKKDMAYKKRIRVLRFATRFLSLILNIAIISTMSFALYKYFTTKNGYYEGRPTWGSNTILWPSIMLLAIAVVTFSLNLATLISYCRSGVKAANKVSNVASYIGYAFLGIHFLVWAGVASAYRAARSPQDLWGYSCSARADAIQEQVKSFLDFGKLCTMQQGSWFISIVEAIVYFLTFVVTIFMLRRASHKKKIGKMRESLNMETGYMQSHEMGGFKPIHGKKYMPLDG